MPLLPPSACEAERINRLERRAGTFQGPNLASPSGDNPPDIRAVYPPEGSPIPLRPFIFKERIRSADIIRPEYKIRPREGGEGEGDKEVGWGAVLK